MSDEKTEEPTEKKLEDAHKKGQHAKSQDLGAGLSLLAMTLCLSAAGEATTGRITAVVTRLLQSVEQIDADTELSVFISAHVIDLLMAILPFVALSVFIGVAAQAAQVGLRISFEPITPDFEKVNPGSGLKKLFSMKSFIEFGKTILKAVALVAVVWQLITGLLPLLMASAYLEPPAIATLGWDAILRLMGAAVLVFLVLGPVDFGLQKFLFIRDQRMSKDEVKREYKESEGDPQLKGKRKQLAHEMANSAPKQAVPGASVVVTNPTHYAVALRYVAGETGLPIVVAKGVDAEAQVIRQIAEEHHVPIVSDPPLARTLYRLPVSEPIPETLFEAVAAVLRWVEQVRAARS
ncbi:type III secretion system export apparatus subunit SctU [Ideonella sp. DXS29W]|uniref:Type III secretion system export apparatus subunit SctU n=1 Tax=Ideonella lacteola TaxID=2984193 RepID=A0ABU9BKF9_9BURK